VTAKGFTEERFGDKIERREMVVSLDQYPYGFGLGPNPRLPNLGSLVSGREASSE